MKKKVYLLSLGCSKNLVDSENILGLLTSEGYSIVSEPEGADIAVVNTCGFIQQAVEECIENILYLAEKKKKGDLGKLIVTGCFVQRYGYKLAKEIPEVDGWMGTGELTRINELIEKSGSESTPFFINRPLFIADHSIPRVHTTPFYTSYLKIAEGCSHKCSFCAIPGLRGPLRSRKPDSLISEAMEMRDRGVKEVNLIAQDTTAYGKDLGEKGCLEDLLKKLLIIDGFEWIRILYSHPNEISDELLGLMEKEKAICPYIDIPLQHVNPEILRAMGRSIPDMPIRGLIERIRGLKRKISIRTTIMVGFPGETDKIFAELYDFIEETRFDHLGSFVYSPEKGTPAARLTGIPDKRIAEERRDAIMKLQSDISMKKNREIIGSTVPVLIEGVSPETDLLLCGRSSRMAPDVDGQILINKGEGTVGEIMPVRINEAYSYDLVGEII
jgi:ribosomal protein S12 methylthiotransferase